MSGGQDPRRDFSAPISVEVSRSDGSRSTEIATNLSPRGLCLRVRDPLGVGERVGLRFTLPPAGPTIVATGKVVWTDHEEHMDGDAGSWETGVHLTELGAGERAALGEFASQPVGRRR